MPTLLQAFKQAVLYIRNRPNPTTDKQIAHTLGISPSYLSQVLNNKKPLTPDLIKTFETQFAIDLNNPLTFLDLSVIGVDTSPGLDLEQFLDVYSHLREILLQQHHQINALTTALETAQQQINIWGELFRNCEPTFQQQKQKRTRKTKKK